MARPMGKTGTGARHHAGGDSLRLRAEEEVGPDDAHSKKALPPNRVREMLHELRVHQIELEMQNEELRRAEKELQASRERYFALYDLAPVGYFMLTKEGVILEANLTASKLLHFEQGALMRRPLSHFILFADHGLFFERHKRLFETGESQVFDLRLVRQDASQFWAHFETAPAMGLGGSSVCLAAINDITGQKQSEEALKESEEAAEAASHAKDRFIAVLSHELRTPLTPVLATVSALERKGDLPDSLRLDMELIQRNVELEAALIDDLLDVTRITRGNINLEYEPVDVHLCLKRVVEVCQRQIETKHLEVTLELRASRHHIWADPVRLNQVFWNLMKNAVKFTPEGGRITVRSLNVGDRLKIEFADTGIGIEPEIMPEIFNPFKQGDQGRAREYGGLGLGLSIANALVELHHGRMTAFSEGLNKGATFTVELSGIVPGIKPVVPASTMEGEQHHRQHLHTILLVEDHPDTLEVLHKILKNWGYSVTTATCARKAMELAAGQPFDLIISDLGLPDSSGLDLMQQVKARCGIPGIALSGYGTEEDIRRSLAAGFAKHLVKPVNMEVLRMAIQQTA